LVAGFSAGYSQTHQISVEDEEVQGSVYLFKDPEESDANILIDGILAFLKFFLLLSSILPISLLTSLEIIKVLQSLFISFDAKMYALDVDQRCKVMSISLNEELGCINNIFTDKTGTLTSNDMIFKA
jgi:P-type E1-E2 ATPase